MKFVLLDKNKVTMADLQGGGAHLFSAHGYASRGASVVTVAAMLD